MVVILVTAGVAAVISMVLSVISTWAIALVGNWLRRERASGLWGVPVSCVLACLWTYGFIFVFFGAVSQLGDRPDGDDEFPGIALLGFACVWLIAFFLLQRMMNRTSRSSQ